MHEGVYFRLLGLLSAKNRPRLNSCDPVDPEVFDIISNIYYEDQNMFQKLRIFGMSYLKPTIPHAYLILGYIFYINCEFKPALSCFQKFLDFFPNDLEAALRIAFCHRQLGSDADFQGVVEKATIANSVLASGAAADTLPEEIKIELTTKCNMDCEFCFNDKSITEELSLSAIMRLIDSISESGIKAVRLTGGEPLLRKDLAKILSYSKSKGLYTILNSNGVLLDDKSSFLKDVDDLLVSFHDIARKDEIYRIIRQAKTINPSILLRFCTIADRKNISQLAQFYRFFSELFKDNLIDDWFLLRPVPVRNNRQLSFADVKELVESMISLNHEYGIEVYIKNSLPFCSYIPKKVKLVCTGAANDSGHTRLVIDSIGRIKTDYFSKEILGDIKQDSIKDIWFSEKMASQRSLRNAEQVCKSCDYFAECKAGLTTLEQKDYLSSLAKVSLYLIKACESKNESKKKLQVFFRDDDVSSLTPKFRTLMDIFSGKGVPINLAVIPAKLSAENSDFLKSLKRKNPRQIDIHQHGFSHEDHNREQEGEKGEEYEFGEKRSYDKQHSDIKNGKAKLESVFGKDFTLVFCPPYYHFNKDTIQAIEELGFKAISAYKFKDFNFASPNIMDFSANVEFLCQGDNGVELKDRESIINELASKLRQGISKDSENSRDSRNSRDSIGIVLHHEFMDRDSFQLLADIIEVLQMQQAVEFKLFSEMISE